MIVCFEYTFLLTASLIRILDISTKARYILTQPYSSEILYISSIAALFAPIVFFLTAYLIFLVKQLFLKNHSKFKPLPIFFFIIGDIAGVSYLVIAAGLAFNKVSLGYLEKYSKLVRLAVVAVSTLQSGPIITIQIFNNQSNNSWGPKIMFCLATTASWLCFTCLKLIFSNDERVMMTKIQTVTSEKISEIKNTEGNFQKVLEEDANNGNDVELFNLEVIDIRD